MRSITKRFPRVLALGKPVNFTMPRQAQAAGIAPIYQELNQIPQLSITENIFLGSEITRGSVLMLLILCWPWRWT